MGESIGKRHNKAVKGRGAQAEARVGKGVCEKRARRGRGDKNPLCCGCLGCEEWRGMKTGSGTREGG